MTTRVLLQFWVQDSDPAWQEYEIASSLERWRVSASGRYACAIIQPWWRSTATSKGLRIQVLGDMTEAQYTLYLMC